MGTQARALIIDDDDDVLIIMSHLLGLLDYTVETAEFGAAGLEILAKTVPFDIVFLDQNLPDTSGLDLLVKIVESSPNTQVVMMTAYGNISDAVLAIKRGAYDYLIKPVGKEQVKLVADRAMSIIHLKDEINRLENQFYNAPPFKEIISNNDNMQKVLEMAKKIAVLESIVLISGESGTGKELVARAIHRSSSRNNGPFIAVNCAAFTEELLGSALFGFEKGAFTGADHMTKGCFEEAAGGTLFLDEVGDMSPKLQSSLLRVIQEKEFSRLGTYKLIKTDFRLLTATNREMDREVSAGRFRKDLFFRLNVIPLKIPPLRDRREDIPLLVAYFISRTNKSLGKKVGPCLPETMGLLMNHTWPGNCRELENIIEYALAVKSEGAIGIGDLPEYMINSVAPVTQQGEEWVGTYKEEQKLFDKQYLEKALKECKGNITHMAKLTGIPRQNIYKKLKKHGLRE